MSRVLPPLLLTVALLAAWEVACRALAVPAYFLPPPSAVAVLAGPKLNRTTSASGEPR